VTRLSALRKWLTAAEGTHRAIAAGLRVETTTERGSFWGELPSTATLAPNNSFVVGRGVVYPPAMTDHSAKNRAQSHGSSVLLAQKRLLRSGARRYSLVT